MPIPIPTTPTLLEPPSLSMTRTTGIMGVDSPREGGVTIAISSSISGTLSSSAVKVGGVDLDEEEVVVTPDFEWLGDDDNEDDCDKGAEAVAMAFLVAAVVGGIVEVIVVIFFKAEVAVGGGVGKDVVMALRDACPPRNAVSI